MLWKHYRSSNRIYSVSPPQSLRRSKGRSFLAKCQLQGVLQSVSCSGILFNHESPLRPERFVTQKIVRAAYRIASGAKEKLLLGNLNIERDWGLASDYVRAMWLMLQQNSPDDFVIASGETHSLKTFVSLVFSEFNLDWEKHVVSDPQLFRPSDIVTSKASPQKARTRLGWTAKHNFRQLVQCLVQNEIQRHEDAVQHSTVFNACRGNHL